MPVFTRNPLLIEGESIKTESTLGEAFGAGTYTMYEGLVGSLSRMDELRSAEGEFKRFEAVREDGRTSIRQRPLSPMMSPEQAREKLRDNGLEQNLSIPADGIREETLQILMDRKRDELRRQTILAQSTGIGGTIAALTGGLVGSFVDPTNIALAFVPVVGQARYGQMLARAGGTMGRTGVRVGVGGVEGLVGLAPIEAVNYYAHQQQQSDYGAFDSMIAIAGGAFFGSALHGGAGLLGDAVRGFRPAQTRATLDLVTDTDLPARTDAPQLTPLTREQHERAIIMDRLAEGQPVTRQQAMDAARPRTGAEAGQVIDNRLAALERASTDGLLDPSKVRALVAERNQLETLVRAQDKAAASGALAPADRMTPAARAQADQRRVDIKTELERHQTAQGARKELEDIQKKLGNIDSDSELIRFSEKLMPTPDGVKFVDSLPAAIRDALEDDPFMPVRPFIAGLHPATQAGALRMALAQAATGRPIDIAPALFSDPKYLNSGQAFEAARANARLVDGADEAAADAAAKAKPMETDLEDIKAQVGEDEAMIRDLMDQAGMRGSQAFDDSISDAQLQAKKQGEAAKVAAMCMMRTGG